MAPAWCATLAARGEAVKRAKAPTRGDAITEALHFHMDLARAAARLSAAGFADGDRAAAALAWNEAIRAHDARRRSAGGRRAVAARDAGVAARHAKARALLERHGWKVDAAVVAAQQEGIPCADRPFSRSLLAEIKAECVRRAGPLPR